MAKVKLNDVAIEARETWKQSKTDVPVVGLEHLEPDEIWLKRWDLNPDENTFTKGFKKGQLLFGRRRAYQKKMSVASCDGICSGDITVIAARPEKMLPELLPFYLRTDSFFDFAVRGSGGSLSPRVKWSHISDYEFDLPPMEEQKKVAELLWAANDLKESYKKAITATDEMLKAKFREMFGCVGNGDGFNTEAQRHREGESGLAAKNAEVAKSKWPVGYLGMLGKVCMCKRVMASQTKGVGDVPFYKIGTFGGIADSYISFELFSEFIHKYSFPKKGDILLSAAGTIGRCVVYDGEPAYFQDSNIVWIDNDETRVLNQFLLWCYRYISWKTTKGGIIERLYNDNIRNTKIPLPPLALQREFVAIAEKAESAKANLKKSIANIETLIKGLLN